MEKYGKYKGNGLYPGSILGQQGEASYKLRVSAEGTTFRDGIELG